MTAASSEKLQRLLRDRERGQGRPFAKRQGVAFYVSVAELLYDGITDSVFDIGDRLPAIRHMAGLFGTSEITIKKALALLKDEYRVIDVSAGREAEVVRKRRIEEVQRITSFTREMELLGYAIDSTLLEPVREIGCADPLIASLGGLSPNKMSATRIVRLRRIGRPGAPKKEWRDFSVQLSVVFTRPGRIDFSAADLSGSLTGFFHKHEITFDFAEQHATVTTPAGEPLLTGEQFRKVGFLKNTNSPLFKLERNSFDCNHILRERLVNFISPAVDFRDHRFVYSIDTRLLYGKQ